MSARRTRLLAAPLLALLVAPAARADHGFILPSSTALAGDGNVVTFDAAGSDHVFFFDHRPLQLGTIAVLRPDGSAGTPYNTLQGRFRSVFDLKLDQQGTWKVASVQTMIGGTFKLNGEERRVGGRGGPPRPQGGTGGPGGRVGRVRISVAAAIDPAAWPMGAGRARRAAMAPVASRRWRSRTCRPRRPTSI